MTPLSAPRRLAAACLVSASALAHAAEPAAPITTTRISHTRECLSNDTPDWRETNIGLTVQRAPRQVFDLGVNQTKRFGLRDNQFAASATLPLSQTLTAIIDGNVSPTHRVLARHAVGATLQFEFAPAWLAYVGVRSSSFDTATVNQTRLMLERYAGSFSWSASWLPTRAYGTTANGIELRGSVFYNERDSVTLIAAGGEEAASVPGGVVLTDVRALALVGRHWATPNWAFTYALSRTRQGDLYTRNGLQVGAQYAF